MARSFVVAGLVYLLSSIIGAGMTMAGFQVKKYIGKLSVDGWQLKAQEGQLGLAKVDSGRWMASAPAITDKKGLFIAGDPDGKTPTVHLVKENGPHAKWAFEISETWKPNKAGREEGKSNAHILVGESGFRFKMKVAEGPFKNWFVGVDALPPETKSDPVKVPAWRPLKLVQNPKLAAEFEYHEDHYEVGHK
jgi:hypothetical protein